MTIREATAMWLLYHACLTAETTGDLIQAARRAQKYMPSLAEFDGPPIPAGGLQTISEFPFLSHRTQAEVFRDEQSKI